jgi:N,N'-diacetyllegionaminate synthase
VTTDCTIIAEVACVHEGDAAYLRELAAAARAAGADAIKFQIFAPCEVVSPDHPDYSYLERISFSEDQWVEIAHHCAALGLGIFIDASGPFSFAVAERVRAHLTGLKIHSSDIQNDAVVGSVRRFGVPILVGCGGTPLIDLFEMFDQLGTDCPLVLMHGHQAFPKLDGAPGGPPARPVALDDLELWRVTLLTRTFPGFRVGLADHLAGDDPLSILVPAFAATLGATVIEKHLTLTRRERREDYFSALEPEEFRRMVDAVRAARAALGSDRRTLRDSEHGYACEMKRAPVLVRALEKGAAIGRSDFTAVRSGAYVSAARAHRVVGRRLRQSLGAGASISTAHLDYRVGIFCNARLASSRLPRKALLPFYKDYTTLGYLLKRLVSYPGRLGQVVLATTTHAEDDALAEIASQIEVPCFRGADEDVMGRMVGCADTFGWDVLIRITGDDQFVSCEYADRALRYHLEYSLDYTRISGLPLGMASEIIDVQTLRRIHRTVVNRGQTEHLTWYLDSDLICRNAMIEADIVDQYPDLRVTLDYEQDYDLMREVARLAHEGRDSFYVATDVLLRTLADLAPCWRHRPTLWPITRAQLNTTLLYRNVDNEESRLVRSQGVEEGV